MHDKGDETCGALSFIRLDHYSHPNCSTTTRQMATAELTVRINDGVNRMSMMSSRRAVNDDGRPSKSIDLEYGTEIC